MKFTRDQYLAQAKSDDPDVRWQAHRRYFGQLVSERTIQYVLTRIVPERIRASQDRHFKDIPLKEWERLTHDLPGSYGFGALGDYYTLANGVCLAKEAALQWKEKQT
jgi:hypothetical protein